MVTVQTFQQAMQFATELDKGVEVHVLNPSLHESQHQSNKMDSSVYRVGGDSVA